MMNRPPFTLRALLLAGCAFTSLALDATAEDAPKKPVAIAVFDFQGSDEASRETAAKISSLLGVELSSDARFLTVERAELEKALGEQELGLSGTVSEAAAAKVGQLTGARLLVTGRGMKVDKNTIVVAKLIGTETGRVFAEKITIAGEGSIEEASVKLGKRIGELATANGEALMPKTENPEELAARLKKSIEGKPRHAVSVAIPEEHFGRPVIDPAAETEISLVLNQCGFTLVDGKSATKPEVEIVGEAFSERGLQKGALVSCRARVEIKVRRVSDGTILLADRQVGVAVDTAEHVAAKSALQAAALKLAERVLPVVAY